MLNNKWFVVSAILYTILLAFLLFLGVTLAIFSSATSTIGKATDDLVNSTELSIRQVGALDSDGNPVANADDWYKAQNNVLIKINSKYGIIYWPRDFGGKIDTDTGKISSLNNNRHDIYIYCGSTNTQDANGNTIVTYKKCTNNGEYSILRNGFYVYVSYGEKPSPFNININDDSNGIKIGK